MALAAAAAGEAPAMSEQASFLFGQEDAAKLHAALHASPALHGDVQRRLACSLQETHAELRAEHPEDVVMGGGLQRARRRAASELSDYVARSRSATPALRPSAPPARSPGMMSAPSPLPSPTLVAMPPPAAPPTIREGSEEVDRLDTASMYMHDGLLDHEQLIMGIYASEGLDFASVQGQAQRFLAQIGLKPLDLGIQNVDEDGNTLINQCFYLCLARGILGHEETWPTISGLALRLKRAIEVAVLAQRQNAGSGDAQAADVSGLCDNAMAFADFLPLAMKHSKENCDGASDDDTNVLAELAVCVLDSIAGHVEVYLGSKYKELDDISTRERNLVLLWYTPGHYQCLVIDDELGSKVVMTYDRFKEILMEHGVVYIETVE